MSKAIKVAKISARGGFHLFLGQFLSTAISALGSILLVRFLAPTEYGLYAIALMPTALIGLFRDWGMNFAMIKHLAEYKSENRTVDMKKVVASGILFESVLGVLLSIICFFLASFLAINVFHRPELQPLIGITSIIILAGGLLTAARSTFIGFEKMELNSLTMICQSSFRSFLAPLLVFLGYGIFGAVLGYTIAFLISGILGILTIHSIFYKDFRRESNDKLARGIGTTLKTMFRYGFPLFVSTVLTGFLAQFYNFMMAIYCTDSMIGNYKASVNFIVLISLFREPIATVLFPAFSKLNAKKDKKTLRTIFQYSVKYASFLTAPVTVAIMVLSGPLVVTLFGAEYTYAPLFLALNAIIYLYSALGNLSLGSFLNGQGRTMVTMRLTMIRLAIGFLLSLLLIPSFGIIGLITTLLISGLPSLTIGLWWTRKHFGITVEWGSSARILASSATAAVTTQLVLSRLQTLEWESLIIGGLIFFVTYLVVTPLLRAINIDDVRNLKQMLSEFGPLSHLLNFLLNLIERLAMIFQKTQDKT